jgi:hypothetical protein
MTDERGEARFMIFTVEPLFMPTFERRFQGEAEKITVGMSPDAAHHLSFGSVGLVFHKEIMLKWIEVWEDDNICLTEVDKDGDLKNKIWIQMNQFDFVVVEEATQKLVGWETKPVLEGVENNDFVGFMHGNIFILSQPSLKDNTGREKVVVDEFEKLALVNG